MAGGVRGLTGWWGVVIEAPEPRALAEFYSALLGWPVAGSDAGTVSLNRPGEKWYLAVQRAEVYTRPTWPPVEGGQACSPTWTSRSPT